MAGLSVAVVVFGASVFPAAADPVQSARQQAQALQGQVVAAADRVHQLTMAYQDASAQAAALDEQAATDRSRLAALEHQVAAARQTLSTDALLGYMGGVTTTPGIHTGAVSDPAVRAVYLEVATGDISQALSRYRTDRDRVAAEQAGLAQEASAARAEQQQVASDRQQALSVAEQVQGQLAGIQAHIAQMVAAQQAAAQAAAQQAAAQQAAAQQAAAQAAAQRALAPSGQGLPVGGGLVSLVTSVVSAQPAPSAAPTPPASSPGGGAGGVWLQLRQCESGDNYQANTGNGYYGAYQFSQQTWTALGYPGRPDLEPPAMQDQAAMQLQARDGWGQWPACAAALGLG